MTSGNRRKKKETPGSSRPRTLREVRQARGQLQKFMAKALDRDQSVISKLEARNDLRISMLAQYLNVMGGRLEIYVRFPDDYVQLQLTADRRRGARRKRR